MPTRYTAKEIKSIVSQIDVEAKQAGLLPTDAKLVYSPGNSSYHIAGSVEAVQKDSNGYRHPIRVDFLPEFKAKQTKNDHAVLLQATLRVFHALRRQQESAAAAARKQLEERGPAGNLYEASERARAAMEGR